MAGSENVASEIDEFLAAYGGESKHLHRVSPELIEILLAYGPPPKMPEFKGDAYAYAAAVNQFVKLSSTPEAVSRSAAVEQYFDAKRLARAQAIDADSWPAE